MRKLLKIAGAILRLLDFGFDRSLDLRLSRLELAARDLQIFVRRV